MCLVPGARHRSNIRAPPRPLPQMYVQKVWDSVWPEEQKAIHSQLGSKDVTYLSLHPMTLSPRVQVKGRKASFCPPLPKRAVPRLCCVYSKRQLSNARLGLIALGIDHSLPWSCRQVLILRALLLLRVKILKGITYSKSVPGPRGQYRGLPPSPAGACLSPPGQERRPGTCKSGIERRQN